MKKTLIAASLLVSTSGAMAHQCDVNIEGNVSLVNNVLTVTTEEQDVIAITAGETLRVNGKSVVLNAEQQQWMSSYYNGIYQAVPAVAEIALDGVAIASSAVTEVFGGLLGTDSNAVDKIQYKLDEIRDKIQTKFYAQDGSIQLQSTHFSDGELFGAQWEDDFEEAIEEVVSSSIGHLMVAIGQQLIFGDGDGSFEQRMETFGEDIERKVEAQAAVIEEKADALCYQMVDIDKAENQLQASLSELSGLDLISVNKSHQRM
ncbi:YggN family protein [Aliiglaciecola litoralis]|uniref:DUF2884 family protein n=1 Tax=Aliiglaciecola litoralis TaxID=582857 RepID=A0ABN1LDV5_9ALTE